MVIVDTSIWVDHLRHNNPQLQNLLANGLVYSHPLIIEELACGHLKNRETILSSLETLSKPYILSHEEILKFISERRLAGLGIGAIDTHLLASALKSRLMLWTTDKNLLTAAKKFGISY